MALYYTPPEATDLDHILTISRPTVTGIARIVLLHEAYGGDRRGGPAVAVRCSLARKSAMCVHNIGVIPHGYGGSSPHNPRCNEADQKLGGGPHVVPWRYDLGAALQAQRDAAGGAGREPYFPLGSLPHAQVHAEPRYLNPP